MLLHCLHSATMQHRCFFFVSKMFSLLFPKIKWWQCLATMGMQPPGWLLFCPPDWLFLPSLAPHPPAILTLGWSFSPTVIQGFCITWDATPQVNYLAFLSLLAQQQRLMPPCYTGWLFLCAMLQCSQYFFMLANCGNTNLWIFLVVYAMLQKAAQMPSSCQVSGWLSVVVFAPFPTPPWINAMMRMPGNIGWYYYCYSPSYNIWNASLQDATKVNVADGCKPQRLIVC